MSDTSPETPRSRWTRGRLIGGLFALILLAVIVDKTVSHFSSSSTSDNETNSSQLQSATAPTASAGRTVVPATGEVARPPRKSVVVYDGDQGDFHGKGNLQYFSGWWETKSGNRFDLWCDAPGNCSALLQGYDLVAVLVPYEDGDRIKWVGTVTHTRRGKIKTTVSF